MMDRWGGEKGSLRNPDKEENKDKINGAGGMVDTGWEAKKKNPVTITDWKNYGIQGGWGEVKPCGRGMKREK